MKFIASIKDENLKKTTYLFLDEEGRTAGCTYHEGNLTKVDDSIKDFFSLFSLADENEVLDNEDGFEVILDKTSGLKHYFKEGVENFLMLLIKNSRGIDIFKGSSGGSLWGRSRELFVGTYKVLFTLITSAALSFMITSSIGNANYNAKEVFYFYNPIFDKALVLGEDEVFMCDGSLSVEALKSDIESSKNLSALEKMAIINEELLEDVIPYYQGTEQEVLTRIFHRDMGILPFTEKEKQNRPNSLGFWSYDNMLHIRDYEQCANLADNLYFKEIAGHEYAHLLEANYDLPFLFEAVAEIICNEYYCRINWTAGTYPNQVKYTKVLMEIFGPEVVWDRIFRIDSNKLEDAVKPYLSESEYSNFFNILRTHNNDITQDDFDMMERLLGKMFKAKFNYDMQENPMINTILSPFNTDYRRTYFCESLSKEKPSFYGTLVTLSFEEACEKGIIKDFYVVKWLNDYEKWKDLNSPNIIDKHVGIAPANDSVINIYDYDVKKNDIGIPVGVLTIECLDEKMSMTVDDAVKMGYVKYLYGVTYLVDKNYFLQHKDSPSVNVLFKEGEPSYSFNRDSMTITQKTLERVYVPEIVRKENDLRNRRFGT